MKEQHFNIIATIVVILIAIGIGFVALNKSNETETLPENKEQQSMTTETAATGTPLTYLNNDYGFTFSLPASWKGYTLILSTWQGQAIARNGETPYTTGPLISIRSPLWTEQAPRQDIPIMVFTLLQWQDLQRETFHVGAAPIPPSELSRNANYVFALPARYNYAFLAGFEEVQSILDSKPLHAF